MMNRRGKLLFVAGVIPLLLLLFLIFFFQTSIGSQRKIGGEPQFYINQNSLCPEYAIKLVVPNRHGWKSKISGLFCSDTVDVDSSAAINESFFGCRKYLRYRRIYTIPNIDSLEIDDGSSMGTSCEPFYGEFANESPFYFGKPKWNWGLRLISQGRIKKNGETSPLVIVKVFFYQDTLELNYTKIDVNGRTVYEQKTFSIALDTGFKKDLRNLPSFRFPYWKCGYAMGMNMKCGKQDPRYFGNGLLIELRDKSAYYMTKGIDLPVSVRWPEFQRFIQSRFLTSLAASDSDLWNPEMMEMIIQEGYDQEFQRLDYNYRCGDNGYKYSAIPKTVDFKYTLWP